MTNELAQNQNEMTKDERPDYSEFYDRLKIQYSAGQELYNKDPDRFPAYSKEDIIERVETEGWILGDARGGGVCVRMPNGRIIYGSPPPAPLPVIADGFQVAVDEFRLQLIELNQVTNTPELFFKALMTKVQQSDVKALQLYKDLFLTPQQPTRGPSLSAKTLNVYQAEQKEEQSPSRNV